MLLDEFDYGRARIISDLSKDNVSSIKPWSVDSSDVELRTVSIGSGVGHGNDSDFVFKDEVFVFKFGTIDGLSSSAVMISEVSSLDHEARNDSMED